MQVSAAAAADVGGGDRFDETENRALGRAYLAHMFRRYGSWPDAIAAYNCGPGHLDEWIGGGRPADKFPAAVDRYRACTGYVGTGRLGESPAGTPSQPSQI
jgi:soluble lytic murein transglycosylase-like protein